MPKNRTRQNPDLADEYRPSEKALSSANHRLAVQDLATNFEDTVAGILRSEAVKVAQAMLDPVTGPQFQAEAVQFANSHQGMPFRDAQYILAHIKGIV